MLQEKAGETAGKGKNLPEAEGGTQASRYQCLSDRKREKYTAAAGDHFTGNDCAAGPL